MGLPRAQRVGPVPPVQGRVGDEGVEAGAEGDRGRPRRSWPARRPGWPTAPAPRCGPRRDRGRAGPLDRGHAAGPMRPPRAPRPIPGPRPVRRTAARCGAAQVGQRHGHRAQSGDQHQHAQAEDRPVERDAEDRDTTGRTRPIGASGDRPTATAAASSDPATTARQDAEQPVAERHGRAAPSARSVPRSSPPRRSWRPITWLAISRAARAAIPPKTPEGDRLGLDGPLRPWLGAGGDVEDDRKACRQQPLDLGLGGSHVRGRAPSSWIAVSVKLTQH